MATIFQPDLETMDPADRADLQSRRLVALLQRLIQLDSPYWRGKLDGVDVGSVRGVDDLHQLPFTVKAELRDTYPFGMLAVPMHDVVRVHASSGTSGKPTVVAYTAGDIEVFAEVNARSIACAGGTADDIIHVAYGYGLFTGGLGLHYGVERLGACAVPASGGNTGLQVQLLEDLGAVGLCSTPSFAMLLAERAEADGLMDRLGVRYGIFGAEPWSQAYREQLEAHWSAATGSFDACDIYGLSEIIGPGVAMEARESKGALFVFDDHFLPEIVDPDTGDPVAEGEYGELVLTTLTKEALPILRYRTGDVTRFVDDACPSGRTHRRIERLQGRVDDMLVIRGVNVFPREIEAVLLDDPAVGAHYGIVVDRRETMPQLQVRAELRSSADVGRVHELRDVLQARLLERCRLRIDVTLVPPGGFPRQEVGKARRVFAWEPGADDPCPVDATA